MKKLFLMAAVCCMPLLALADAGPICDYLLGTATATSGNTPAYVKWTTDAEGNVDITIMPYNKVEETADKPTAWRGRGMADNLTKEKGWEMSIDGKDTVLADFFEKNYTPNGAQSQSPTVYQLKIKEGKKTELEGKTVVIKKAKTGDNICWWTPRGNNCYATYEFEYLYGSGCDAITLSAPTELAITNDILTFKSVEGAENYAANIYLNSVLVKTISDATPGIELQRLMRTGATFQVTVVASAGAMQSDASEAVDWVVADEETEVGNSEYCDATIGSGNSEAYMTWTTDDSGNIQISISGDSAYWRADAFKGISYFYVGECPAALFFSVSYITGSNVYTLQLTDPDKAPIHGETIRFKGTSQWTTRLNTNAYNQNTDFTYTYSSTCSTPSHPTAMRQTTTQPVARKTIINGHLYLILDNHIYDAQGKCVQLSR